VESCAILADESTERDVSMAATVLLAVNTECVELVLVSLGVEPSFLLR